MATLVGMDDFLNIRCIQLLLAGLMVKTYYGFDMNELQKQFHCLINIIATYKHKQILNSTGTTSTCMFKTRLFSTNSVSMIASSFSRYILFY